MKHSSKFPSRRKRTDVGFKMSKEQAWGAYQKRKKNYNLSMSFEQFCEQLIDAGWNK